MRIVSPVVISMIMQEIKVPYQWKYNYSKKFSEIKLFNKDKVFKIRFIEDAGEDFGFYISFCDEKNRKVSPDENFSQSIVNNIIRKVSYEMV